MSTVTRIHWRGVVTIESRELHVVFDDEHRWTRSRWQETGFVAARTDGTRSRTGSHVVCGVEWNVFRDVPAVFLRRVEFDVEIHVLRRAVHSSLKSPGALFAEPGCGWYPGRVDGEYVWDESAKRIFINFVISDDSENFLNSRVKQRLLNARATRRRMQKARETREAKTFSELMRQFRERQRHSPNDVIAIEQHILEA